jgi:hypothetical protein
MANEIIIIWTAERKTQLIEIDDQNVVMLSQGEALR